MEYDLHSTYIKCSNEYKIIVYNKRNSKVTNLEVYALDSCVYPLSDKSEGIIKTFISIKMDYILRKNIPERLLDNIIPIKVKDIKEILPDFREKVKLAISNERKHYLLSIIEEYKLNN